MSSKVSHAGIPKEKSDAWTDVEDATEFGDSWTRKLLRLGVETNGIHPVPVEQRIDTQYSKIFFIWFSSNFNILSFSAGTLGPVIFGLGVRDTCLTILFFNILFCFFPAYLSTWGPRTGMRQMVISRYTFGYFGVIVPCIFNLIGMCGFSILNSILGGQALSSVSSGNLTWTVGIVVITIISLLISFCGYKVLHWYERIAWFPVLVTFAIALGVGGKHLVDPPPATPASASSILNFASTLAGFAVTWSALSSDFTTYLKHNVRSWKIFWYSYFGLLLPMVLIQCLGAAVVVGAMSVPDWEAGYAEGNIGGLLEAVLHPTRGFGKFLTVLLSLSVTANIAATFYCISVNIQVFIPPLVVVPRYVFSFLAAAIVLPLSIVGAHRFYDALVNFLGIIGYWASAYVAIIILEHLVIRKGDFSMYNMQDWNSPRRLPTGIAALGTGIASFGLVIPSMHQVWFVGPIAKHTGDIGFEVAFAVSAILYLPFRWLEIKWRGRL